MSTCWPMAASMQRTHLCELPMRSLRHLSCQLVRRCVCNRAQRRLLHSAINETNAGMTRFRQKLVLKCLNIAGATFKLAPDGVRPAGAVGCESLTTFPKKKKEEEESTPPAVWGIAPGLARFAPRAGPLAAPAVSSSTTPPTLGWLSGHLRCFACAVAHE